jgi:hypothetical protein
MRIFIDIETCPTTDPAVIADIRAGINPPANYSKPDSIAQWRETKGEQAALEAIGKTALSPEDGSIIAIGVGLDDDQDPVVFVRDPSTETDAYVILDALTYVNDAIQEATTYSSTDPGKPVFTPTPYWCGHNITGFDLPFIWKRLVINEINPDFPLPCPDEIRHGKTCFDIMQAWAGYRGMIGLSRLCRVLGLPDPKQNEQGITGANVWEFWRRGDMEVVKSYCAADVIAARQVFHRIDGIGRRNAV